MIDDIIFDIDVVVVNSDNIPSGPIQSVSFDGNNYAIKQYVQVQISGGTNTEVFL